MKDIGKFGAGAPYLGNFKIHETLTAATLALWTSGTTGTLSVSTTAGLADVMGLVVSAPFGGTLTYSTTQGDTEGVAKIIYNPFMIYKLRIVPSTTAGTAFANGDGYFLTEDSGDAAGLTITDGQVGGSSSDDIDGEVFCIGGANVGQSRIITAQSANVNLVVTVPWSNDIAIGDTFVYSQYGPGVIAVTTTSDLTEADGSVAGAAGGDARVIRTYVETREGGATTSAPYLYLEMICLDHAFNSFTN